MYRKFTRTSPLRQAMIEQMRIRNFSEHTLSCYCRVVEHLATHYHRCPSKISTEEVNDYLLHLIRDKKLSYSSVNQALCGIRFLYTTVLKIDEPGFQVPLRKREQRLPDILTRSETLRLITAHPKLIYRGALYVLYGCGLRLSEAASLKIADINGVARQANPRRYCRAGSWERVESGRPISWRFLVGWEG